MSKSLDALDKKIIKLLSQNGRNSVKSIADELDITTPTVHARIDKMSESGILKIAGLVDVFKAKELVTAILGIKVLHAKDLDGVLDQVTKLKHVTRAVTVTGQYDLFVEVVLCLDGGLSVLNEFLSKEFSEIKGMRSFETFVVMNSKDTWSLLPPNMDKWFD